jgi:uncharacterized protein (TIRG00374 family)
MRKRHLIISIIIIGLSLYYVFNNVSIAEVGKAIISVRYIYLFPALFLVGMSFLFRAMRWRYLIGSIKEVKTVNLLSPLMVGFMGNILPARAGELIRAYLLGKKESISFSASFATIFMERLLDMAMVLLLLLWVILFKAEVFASGDGEGNHQLMGYMIKFGWISFLGCLFIFLFSVLLQYKNDWAMKIARLCIKPLPHKWGKRVIGLLDSFTEGLKVLKDKRGFFASIILSFLLWTAIVFSYYPLYQAFEIENILPVISSLVILTLAIDIFIVLFPTPAFLGAFQAACVIALHEVFGIQKAIAASYGIVAWLVMMGFVIIVGIIFVVKDNISFAEFSVSREQIK